MIKVLQKTDAILGIVARERDKATLSGLSRSLKMHKATLSHILKALEELGFVSKNQARCYAVGPRIAELADGARRLSLLQEIAAEETKSLSGQLRETVSVSILRDGIRQRIAFASCSQSVTVAVESAVETRGAPFNTATGRALMAWQEKKSLRQVLKQHGLPGAAWGGITSESELSRVLAGIRRSGIAVWRSEDSQAEALAVPVFGPDNKAWAAIGLAAPVFRFRGRRRAEVINALKAAGKRMGAALALRGAGTGHAERNKEASI